MPHQIPIAALDDNCAAAMQFFRDDLLKNLIRGGSCVIPEPATSMARSPSTAYVRRLKSPVIVATAVSEAGYIPACQEIVLTEGFLCERWCASYFLLHSALTMKFKPDAPLMHLLEHGQVFNWHLDSPLPTQIDQVHVGVVNRIFPWVISCSVLHEMGHAIEEQRTIAGPERELACDRFAARYLLGRKWGEAVDYRRLAVAISLCCICSEVLTKEDFVQRRHPNPVDRLLGFLRAHARHPAKTWLDQHLYMVCTVHVMKLVREYRRNKLDAAMAKDRSTLREILHDLRDCWAP